MDLGTSNGYGYSSDVVTDPPKHSGLSWNISSLRFTSMVSNCIFYSLYACTQPDCHPSVPRGWLVAKRIWPSEHKC